MAKFTGTDDVTRRWTTLEKKENEVMKLTDKLESRVVNNVSTKVKEAKKSVRKHLPGIR
jgi:hypothetical protein